MTESAVDDVARSMIQSHERSCDERMGRIEGMFTDIKHNAETSNKDIWTELGKNRERMFNVVLKLVPWMLGGLGVVVLGLIGYIAKGIK